MRVRFMSGLLALVVPVTFAVAQDVTPTIGAGSKAVLFTLNGLSNLGAGDFEGGFGAKYFFTGAIALRAGLEFGHVGADLPAPVTTARPVGIDGSYSGTKFGLSLAGEYHFLPGRVSPYFGLGLGFATASSELKTPETGTTANPPVQTTIKNAPDSASGFNPGTMFGVGGILGIEFFVTKEISLGAEYQLGYSMLSRSDVEEIEANQTLKTKMGSLSTFGIRSTGGLTLSVYF